MTPVAAMNGRHRMRCRHRPDDSRDSHTFSHFENPRWPTCISPIGRKRIEILAETEDTSPINGSVASNDSISELWVHMHGLEFRWETNASISMKLSWSVGHLFVLWRCLCLLNEVHPFFEFRRRLGLAGVARPNPLTCRPYRSPWRAVFD